jgi:glycosyltransferase involved in cell wall biosynthesis
MVQEGVNGALAEAGNPVALADAIVRLLKSPHPERLRQEARKSLDAYRPHLVEQAYRELTKSML